MLLTNKLTSALLLFILALSFLLRATGLGYASLWYDEILQARIELGDLGALLNEIAQHAAMPLDYIIGRVAFQLGSAEFILRFPALVFSTLSVAVLYRLGKLLFGRMEGLVAALLLAVSSFAIIYAQEARPYSLYLLLTLTSFYYFYRAILLSRTRDWLFYALFVVASVLTHLFALFVVGAQILFLMLGLFTRAVTPARAALFSKITVRALIAVGVALGLVFVALTFTPYISEMINAVRSFTAFLLAPNLPGPEEWSGIAPGESPPLPTWDFFYHRVLENFSGGGIAATALFVALGLAGIAARIRRQPWETLLLVMWALAPSALIILVLIQRATLFAARYLIFALPPWLLLCACGIVALGVLISRGLEFAVAPSRRPQLLAGTIALLALIWVIVALDRAVVVIGAPKENWQAAGEFLDANVRPGDAVLAPGGGAVIFYYAPISATQRVEVDTVEQIAAAEEQHPRVWFVNDRYYYDPGGTINAWLQARGALGLKVDDAVQVYYWRSNTDSVALLADARQFVMPQTPDAYVSRGDQLAAGGDVEAGATDFERALALATTNAQKAQVHTGFGDLYRRAGEMAKAAEEYRAALAFDGQNIDAAVGLARVLLNENQPEAAGALLQRSLAITPDSYAALYFLAEYYDRTGQSDAAKKTYGRAAEIVPDLPAPP